MRTPAMLLVFAAATAAQKDAAPLPLWNGVDFAGWHGQRHESPYKLAAMDAVPMGRRRTWQTEQ